MDRRPESLIYACGVLGGESESCLQRVQLIDPLPRLPLFPPFHDQEQVYVAFLSPVALGHRAEEDHPLEAVPVPLVEEFAVSPQKRRVSRVRHPIKVDEEWSLPRRERVFFEYLGDAEAPLRESVGTLRADEQSFTLELPDLGREGSRVAQNLAEVHESRGSACPYCKK